MTREVTVASDLIAEIAARLDLREPNREALVSIAYSVSQHHDVDGRPPPFEGVVDSATGVGKTFILAAALEYFVGRGHRNFAVVTPGRTILEKTVRNFTKGDRKSLVDSMSIQPLVITADNFATPAIRAAMDDPEEVKLYVFTVQALTTPTTKTGRKTHKFQEGLGAAFYAYLQALSDLMVFADEHHVYYGPAFSRAVRDLEPYALIGLTATAHKRTPAEAIIYRYPLAAAIADQFVKTPVIVGRRDDRSDPETKLLDGVNLLELKAEAVRRYRIENPEAKPVNPVMLIVAQTIADADEYGKILKSSEFLSGRYADKVLVVHSDAPDEALTALETVEDLDSPIRVIISVGMLKEGWDVANVYVVASMRASVSEILTEQTLGRGLRLPFGSYTGVEFLDSLEVIAHERYEELLKRAGVINEQFIDHRTRAIERLNAEGRKVAILETTRAESAIEILRPGQEERAPSGVLSLGTLEARAQVAQNVVEHMQVTLAPRQDLPPFYVPVLRMTAVESPFSLADITNVQPFRDLGRRLAADPVGELRRQRISARIETGKDGMRRTVLVTASAVDRVISQGRLLPLDQLVTQLTDTLLGAPVVPARKGERAASGPIIGALLEGLGTKAEEVLSAYFDRTSARLIELVNTEHRIYVRNPSYQEVVELTEFAPLRIGRSETSG